MQEVEIPQTLDAPPLILIFDGYQFTVTMVGVMVGMLTGYLIVGSIIGLLIGSVFTKFADKYPDGYLLHLLYWHGVPVLGKGYPESFDREYRP